MYTPWTCIDLIELVTSFTHLLSYRCSLDDHVHPATRVVADSNQKALVFRCSRQPANPAPQWRKVLFNERKR